MTVYVDNALIRWNPPHMPHRTWLMSHMFAVDLEELHAFAAKIGCERSWFQCLPKASWCHYDVTKSKRELALRNGAEEVQYRSLPTFLRELGIWNR